MHVLKNWSLDNRKVPFLPPALQNLCWNKQYYYRMSFQLCLNKKHQSVKIIAWVNQISAVFRSLKGDSTSVSSHVLENTVAASAFTCLSHDIFKIGFKLLKINFQVTLITQVLRNRFTMVFIPQMFIWKTSYGLLQGRKRSWDEFNIYTFYFSVCCNG